MTLRARIILVSLLLTFAVAAHAMGKRPAGEWSFFYFDGAAFAAGKPTDLTPVVALQDGVRPVVLPRPGKLEPVRLEPGTGALVGLCYVQSSRGKLRTGPGYHGVPLLPVRILSGGKEVATAETDGNGYFVSILPPGSYRVGANEMVEVKVESGSTKLVPLRVGKRMVD